MYTNDILRNYNIRPELLFYSMVYGFEPIHLYQALGRVCFENAAPQVSQSKNLKASINN